MRPILSCFLALLFLAPHPRAAACGYFVLGEDYRIALFNPYVIGRDYAPFFYSSELFFRVEGPRHGQDRRRNARAWAEELGNGVRPEDVLTLLYDRRFADYVAALENPAAGGDNPVLNNPAWRVVRGMPRHLEYLLWAKAYETPAPQNLRYDWDDLGREPAVDEQYYADFQRRALEGYARATPDGWLARRYAYQLLLLARYAGDAPALETYYRRHFAGRDDVLSDWARFHRGSQLDDPRRRTLELARAFRVSPEKALAAYQLTPDRIEPARFLAAATTDQERADLYALAAVKEPGRALEHLRTVYRYAPDHPVLPLLVTREMNKLEDWLLSYRLTGYGPAVPPYALPGWESQDTYADYRARRDRLRLENQVRDRQHLREFRAFLAGADGLAVPPAVLALLRAQAALLDGDFAAAAADLGPPPAAGADPLLRAQAGIAAALATLQSGELLTAATTDRLAEQLTALRPALAATGGPPTAFAALNRLASQRYAALGDTTLAYLFHNKSLSLVTSAGWASDYYMRIDYLDRDLAPGTVDRTIDWVQRAPPSARRSYLIGEAGGGLLLQLYDLAATLALRRNEPRRALGYLERLPANYYLETYDFAYNLSVADKRPIVRQLVDLAPRSAAGDGYASAALGDLWYAMSYYGTEWMMLSYGRSSVPPVAPAPWPASDGHAAKPHNQRDFDLIYRASRAEAYWSLAASQTADPELRARIDFNRRALFFTHLLGELRSAPYDPAATPEVRERDAYGRAFDGYAQQYGGTLTYGRIRQQCSWFAGHYR